MSHSATTVASQRPVTFDCGIIEGFYGRQWSWTQRLSLPAKLQQWGYRSYVYAPKGDTSLRSLWQQPFSVGHRDNLRALAQACQAQDIHFGLGLSPAGLQADATIDGLDQLATKVAEIAALKPTILWILFDDLPAGNPDLAANQLAVVEVIRQGLPQARLAVCPSYYSFDPILESLFGACPADYFTELNDGLSPDIDILWTGNKVISESIAIEDLQAASRHIGRQPLIWDNYPVNDGRKTSRFLHLAAFSGRDSGALDYCKGHYANPMNPFALNALPLPSLPRLYREAALYDPNLTFADALQTLPPKLAQLLERDADDFQYLGLDKFTSQYTRSRLAEYQSIDHPVAGEVCAWLQDAYLFDPNCLTE